MPRVLNYYKDDSGSRHPDKSDMQSTKHQRDWFALGGVLIAEEHEDAARRAIASFFERWPQLQGPLHSVELRHQSGVGRWLKKSTKDVREKFFLELDQLTSELPVYGPACVIHRPGYNERYKEKYGRDRWQLCKTAFAISVERAVKHALDRGMKLRVLAEECNKSVDRRTKDYYELLKQRGHPFDPTKASQYQPLSPQIYQDTLHEFRTKRKSSPTMQMADLFLWPICMGGYHKSNRTYVHFCTNGKLLDHVYADDQHSRGCKYSCFEKVEVQH
jgi:hypothetical protein